MRSALRIRMAGASMLRKQCVEEPVVRPVRQELAVAGRERGQRKPPRVLPTIHESVDHSGVLLAKHRTGRIQQRAAGRKLGPQHRQEALLDRRNGGHVGFAPQPRHVRMPAHDARRAARRVQQDGVEEAAVPPCGRLGRVGGLQFGLQLQPAQRVGHPFQAPRVAIQRQQVQVGQLQQVVLDALLPVLGALAGDEQAAQGGSIHMANLPAPAGC